MKNKINFYEKNSIEVLFAKSNHTFPLHSHECFCFGIVESGEVAFTINDQKKVLQEGMVFIIPSNTGVIIETDSQYEYITICIKDVWKEKLKELVFTRYFLTDVSVKEVKQLCSDFIESGDAGMFVESLKKMMEPVVSEVKQEEKCECSQIVQEATQYIREHVNEKFCLEKVAEAVHISKYHLVKVFKREMGVTPN